MKKRTSKPQTPEGGSFDEEPPGPETPWDGIDLAAYGFDFDTPGDDWLARQREAESPRSLGSIGPYELLEEVSRGGQGVVFRARQPGTKRPIAIKRMLAGSFATASMRMRFEREVEAAASLNHPNIVTIYGMETVEDLPLFAMEWVDGVPVNEWADGPLGKEEGPRRDSRRVLEMFLRIADAVQHAHSRGVLHRDLKPSNILVDQSGQPRVLDFGLAKRLDPELLDADSDVLGLTRSSDFMGTPAYASPEQLQVEKSHIDARSDVYSLGVIVFEMLTGKSPYDGYRSVSDLVHRVETKDPPRPSSLEPRLGSEIDTIVLKALSKSPEERYSKVEDLSADLRRYLCGEPILALPPSSLYLLRKLVRRNRLATAFSAVTLLMIGAFAIYATWQNGRLEREILNTQEALKQSEQRRLEALDASKKARDRYLEAMKAREESDLFDRADRNPDWVNPQLRAGFHSTFDPVPGDPPPGGADPIPDNRQSKGG